MVLKYLKVGRICGGYSIVMFGRVFTKLKTLKMIRFISTLDIDNTNLQKKSMQTN